MAKVHITQCLCPKRHCIIAIAYEEGKPVPGCGDLVFQDGQEAEAGLKALVEHFVQDGQLNHWCGICHSRTFIYEDKATGFESLEAAWPFLMRTQLENLATRMALDATSQQ